MIWKSYLVIFLAGATIECARKCSPYYDSLNLPCLAPILPTNWVSRDSVPPLVPIDYNSNLNNVRATTATQMPIQSHPPKLDLWRTTQKPIRGQKDFSSNVFYVISQDFPQTNVVFSPFSIKALLAIINLGAEGETSYQIQNAVPFSEDKKRIGWSFQNLIQSQARSTDVKLQMANKLFYAREKGIVKAEYQDQIQNYFNGEVEGISFGQPQEAANKINNWAAARTENRIRNLISADSLERDTNSVLVNTVYFKAKWEKPFSTRDTSEHDFTNGLGQRSTVPMMFIDDVFHYAEVPEIQAKMVELRYANSNMSMVIILPDKTDGLREVEEAINGNNLRNLFQLFKLYEMKIRIPKFKIQFDVDLQEPLRKVGVSKIFADNAELPGILQDNSLKVSKMQQKAVLDVNEAGSEAAVSSYANFVPLTLPVNQKIFTADHPFIFLIKLSNLIMFMGHYVG